MTHKGNLQDSQEIGSPLPPLLWILIEWWELGWLDESNSKALGDKAEDRGQEGPLRSLREDFEMVSFSLFLNFLESVCAIYG